MVTMMSCPHDVCGKDEGIWIHTKDRYSSVEKHLFCARCGVIQNRSDDRPKAVGYWMNKLGSLGDDLGLTQCQRRLIAKEIEQCEYLQDRFGSFGSGQKEVFKRIVSSFCDASSVDFDGLLW